MIREDINMNNNILLHYMKDNKFKSNCVAIFLTVPLMRETVTLNALIPSILTRGTARLNSMQDIELEMQKLYGASMNAAVEKRGDNFVIKFLIETIKDSIVGENIFEKAVQNISELILTPYLEKGIFSKEYFEQEKNVLDIAIKDKINDKKEYAQFRCIEEMFNRTGYGLYKYGYTEDIANINIAQVYNQYLDILRSARIDIYAHTDVYKEQVVTYVDKYFNNEKLNNRNNIYVPKEAIAFNVNETRTVTDSLDVTQGKLFIGLNIEDLPKVNKAALLVFNAILGGTCNSKMFINVREKEHLAYSAGSTYIRSTNVLLLFAGIELKNYSKALKVMQKELNDTIKGNITKRELEDAKKALISMYKALNDEQYRLIEFDFSNELFEEKFNMEEMIEKIENIKTADIVSIGKKIKMNTIYYLTNGQMGVSE